MRVAPRASRQAVTAVFDDLQPMIDELAMWFARKFRRDVDEIRAEAYCHFLEAYHRFDPDCGTVLQQRVRYIIERRLFDTVRSEIEQSVAVKTTDADVDLVVRPNPEQFDRGEIERGLGRDARAVLSMILDTPAELLDMIRGEHSSVENPGAPVRRCLVRYCKYIGWVPSRIREAFAELSWVAGGNK